jgi:hypothetical protein
VISKLFGGAAEAVVAVEAGSEGRGTMADLTAAGETTPFTRAPTTTDNRVLMGTTEDAETTEEDTGATTTIIRISSRDNIPRDRSNSSMADTTTVRPPGSLKTMVLMVPIAVVRRRGVRPPIIIPMDNKDRADTAPITTACMALRLQVQALTVQHHNMLDTAGTAAKARARARAGKVGIRAADILRPMDLHIMQIVAVTTITQEDEDEDGRCGDFTETL